MCVGVTGGDLRTDHYRAGRITHTSTDAGELDRLLRCDSDTPRNKDCCEGETTRTVHGHLRDERHHAASGTRVPEALNEYLDALNAWRRRVGWCGALRRCRASDWESDLSRVGPELFRTRR